MECRRKLPHGKGFESKAKGLLIRHLPELDFLALPVTVSFCSQSITSRSPLTAQYPGTTCSPALACERGLKKEKSLQSWSVNLPLHLENFLATPCQKQHIGGRQCLGGGTISIVYMLFDPWGRCCHQYFHHLGEALGGKHRPHIIPRA